jgi:trimethylamine corrinoid protein
MQTLENLKKSVLEYDVQGAARYAHQVVQEGIDPLIALDTISAAMQIVGDGYSSGEMWLPDLVGAAGASEAAMPILEEEIRRRGGKTRNLGTIVLGTVKGDIHTIGKSMVGVLLVAAGFRVIDIGADVPTEQFVEAVRNNDADILALSALLTTTAPAGKSDPSLKRSRPT